MFYFLYLEDFNINSKIIIFCLIICLLIPLSTVNASDINNTADDQVLSATPSVDTLSASVNLEQDNDTLSVQENEILSAGISGSNNNNILGDSSDTISYDELITLIKLSDNELKLSSDVKYSTSDVNNIIQISKPFTLDGNGRTIDGNGLASFFKINANNVCLKNLNIANLNVGKAQAIVWKGDNGIIYNCNFTNISSSGDDNIINPGTISWEGNDGEIYESTFFNCTTTYAYSEDGASGILARALNLNIHNNHFINNTGFAVIHCGQPSNNTIIQNCEFFNNTAVSGSYSSIITFRRGLGTIIGCNFTDNKKISSSSQDTLITSRLSVNVIDSYFRTNDDKGIFSGGVNAYNCTFINNTARLYYRILNNVVFDHCTVVDKNPSNTNVGLYLQRAGANPTDLVHVIINNTEFDGGRNSAVYSEAAYSTIINNCTFKNMNLTRTSNSLLYFITNGNKTVITNNKFYDNIVQKNLVSFVENDLSVNFVNNTFVNNKDISGSVIEYDCPFESFNVYPKLYVSENGVGSGVEGDECSLEYAIDNVEYGGTIYLKDGVYTLNTKKTLNANLIGKGDNVIINNLYFDMAIYNAEVKNIIFNNTQGKINFFFNNKFIDCTFINSTKFGFTTSSGYTDYRNDVISHCTFKNLTINTLLDTANSLEFMTMEYSTFDQCTFTDDMIKQTSEIQSTLKNITIKNSQIPSIYSASSGINGWMNVGNLFENITVSHSNITNSLFNTWRTSNDFMFDGQEKNNMSNINVIDCNYTSSNAMFNVFNGYTLKDINLINLNNTQSVTLFDIKYADNIISDIHVIKLSNTINLFINANGNSFDVDGFEAKNINTNSVFSNFGENIIFNSIDFENITVNTDDVGFLVLKTGSTLTNSAFTNFTGHVVVDGDNVQIVDSNFTRGNNSDLNGSSIYLNTGSDMFKVTNCRFISNNASNGTIYVSENCKRPIFNDCNFTDNTAKYNGGALYIVSSPSNTVTAGINPKTNKTIFYFGQDGYRAGYNDFWGYLSDTYTVLYLINNTTGWYPSVDNNYDGHSFESASNDLSKLFNLIDGAEVYFVRNGDVFTPSSRDLMYDSGFDSVTFYGNNTTIIDMGIEINNTGMKVYNITFKDFPKTCIIVNGEDCLFDNCSFVNVGGDNSIYGGAMQINANNTIITNTKFINCNATHETEDIGDAFGGALFINGSNTEIDNCHFEKNIVSNDGSNVYINEGLNNVSLTNNNFTFGNIVGNGHGSSVVVQGTNLKINNNNFTNNTGQIGSAMSIIGDVSFLTVNNNNFTNNTANQNGALYLKFTNSYRQSIMISGNDFTNNTAVNGGALFVDPIALNNFIMTGNDYINNTAAVNGGAVYINCPGFVLSDGVLKNNSATVGGAVYVNATNVLFKDLEFTGNKALTENSMGSAIYVADDVDCNFDNVKLDYNQVYGRNDTSTSSGLRGDIYFADIVSATVDNVVFGDNPYKQYYAVNTMYRGMSIYVNLTGTGRGLSETDTRSDLTTALNHIAPNGIIYFMDDEEFEITQDIYKQLEKANLTNVTFVGVGNKIIKKANDNTNKYLFILLNNKIIKLKIIHLIHHIKNV